jgi:hypothetical protein
MHQVVDCVINYLWMPILSCRLNYRPHIPTKLRRILPSHLHLLSKLVIMGVEPPFIYDHPSRYSFNGPTEKGFNPKAATQASWSPPKEKPKQDGPLLNFNKHPDSVGDLHFAILFFLTLCQYLIVPYGNLNANPMSPNTATKIKYSRRTQLALRVLALLGTLGILFCVIAIKGTSGSLGWIIRIAPAVGLLHTLYAVYHLCRSATGRTAASSASYMLFAAMIDAGLLPFLAFSAFMAHSEYTSGTYGWDTLFGVPLTTWYIVYSTFLLCVIEGGLLLVSLVLGIYLAIVFRQIAKLPPDMNPLEANLTARPHKRNKSELTASEKHMSQASLVSNNRMSRTADPLIPAGRRVPFMHTRTDSADSIPMYQNNSPRSSRLDVSRPNSFYQQSNHPFRGSYAPVNKSLPSPPSRPQSALAPSINSRQAGTGLDHRPARSSQLIPQENSWQRPTHDGRFSPLETPHQRTSAPPHAQVQLFNDENVPPVSPVSSGPSTPDPDRDAEYLDINNWYESPHVKNKKSRDYAPVEQVQQQSPTRAQQARNNRRESLYDFDRDLRSPSPVSMKQHLDPRNPLGMNPPSPAFPVHEQGGPQYASTMTRSLEEPKRYALYDAPVNLPPSSQRPKPKVTSRPSSFLGSGTKSKYYGDLRSSIGSLDGKSDRDGSELRSDTASDYSKENPSDRATTMDSNIEIHRADYDDDDNDEDLDNDIADILDSRHRYQQAHIVNGSSNRIGKTDNNSGESAPRFSYEDTERQQHPYESDHRAIARVVSTTTAHDLSSGYAGLGAEFGRGMGRRREVSGKVVEEGRSFNLEHEDGVVRRGGGAGIGTVLVSKGTDRLGFGFGNGREGEREKERETKSTIAAAGWARFKGL